MKLQVIVDDEMVEKIDSQAQRKGLSRSAYCAQAIYLSLERDLAQQRAFERLLIDEKQ